MHLTLPLNQRHRVGFPGVLGGLIGGLLGAHFGLVSVFWVSLASAVLATACAWQVWRPRHRAAHAS